MRSCSRWNIAAIRSCLSSYVTGHEISRRRQSSRAIVAFIGSVISHIARNLVTTGGRVCLNNVPACNLTCRPHSQNSAIAFNQQQTGRYGAASLLHRDPARHFFRIASLSWLSIIGN